MKKTLLFLFIILFSFQFSNADSPVKKVYVTSNINPHPPVIDGKLDDPVWDKVPWAGDFIQRSPDEGKEPSQETTFKILYCEKNVYIAIKAFDNDNQGIAKTREAYSVALSQNANFFQDFAGKEEKTIDGLITDTDLIQDFVTYLSEVEEMGKHVTPKAVLSPTLGESEISTYVEELSDLRGRSSGDIKNLGKSIKLLSKRTTEHEKNLREEIREIRKKFDQKIEVVKPRVTERTHQIQERYDENITRISKRFERMRISSHQ